MECIMFSLHRGCKLWNLTDPWWAKWFVPDSKLSVINVVSLCSAHSLQIYTRLLFCTLSFEKRLEFGHECMSFGHFLTCFLFPLACWDTIGSLPRTLQSLDILEGRVILYIAKFRQRGGGKGVFVRCQIYTQRDTRCPLSLAKPAPENGPTDHPFGEGLQKQ